MGSTRDIHSRDKNEGAKREICKPVKKGLSFPAFESKK
jgi:hypothetical protein